MLIPLSMPSHLNKMEEYLSLPIVLFGSIKYHSAFHVTWYLEDYSGKGLFTLVQLFRCSEEMKTWQPVTTQSVRVTRPAKESNEKDHCRPRYDNYLAVACLFRLTDWSNFFFFLLLTWLNQRSSESYRANNAPYECTSKPLPQVSLVTGLTTTTGRRQWYSSAQARKPLLKLGQVFAIICHCSTIDLWPRLRPYQVISRPLIEQAARY